MGAMSRGAAARCQATDCQPYGSCHFSAEAIDGEVLERHWRPKNERTVIQATLTLTDMSDLLMQSAPAVLLPVIARDLGFSESVTGGILSFAIFGLAVSKLANGAVVDHVGGRTALLFFLIGLSAATLLVSAVSTTPWLILATVVQYVAHAPIFASQALVVRDSFPQADYNRLFRWLGMTSRLSSFGASVVIGLLLRVTSWRWALRLLGCAGLGAAAIAALFLDASPSEARVVAKASVRDLLCQSWFQLVLLTSSSVTTVCATQALATSFFVGTCLNLEAGEAAAYAGVFPLGIFACTLLPGYVYRSLQEAESKRRLCLGLQLLSLLSCLTLCAAASEVTTTTKAASAKAVLVFFVSFGQGVAWYMFLPATSMELAGERAAFAYSMLDCAGWVASSLVLMSTSVLLGTELRWRGVWGVVTVAALVSVVSTQCCYLAVDREAASRRAPQ